MGLGKMNINRGYYMGKRVFSLMLGVAMIFSVAAFAETDTATSASYQAPAAPAPAPAPVKPAPMPVAPATTGEITAVPVMPASEIGSRMLAMNSYGEDVKALQAALKALGYDLAVDGIFGSNTEAALKTFQTAKGLMADGIYGPKTGAALFVTVDTVTTASIVNSNNAFKAAISSEGTWIITTLKDLSFNEPLVLDGLFYNGKQDDNGNDVVQRKIGLYTQDDDHNVTARFSLTAPKLTIQSPNARIQSGTFNGDVFVSESNFQLKDATVNGNVYFTTQEAKDTFTMDDKSIVTGVKALVELDAATSASITYDKATFKNSLGADGTWIICSLIDMSFDMPLTLEGTLYNGKQDADGNDVIQRKIALYSQDDDRNITRKFTLTVPSVTINSPNARIQGGILVGDVYVDVPNFQLVKQKIDGNIYFTTQEAKDTFKMDDLSEVTGTLTLMAPDVVATASITYDQDTFKSALGTEGTWLIASLQDMAFDMPLTLEGSFYNGKQDADGNDVIQRKIALYSQDADHNITRKFTLTAPSITIDSPNARIQGGVFVGDLIVKVPNFQVVKATIG